MWFCYGSMGEWPRSSDYSTRWSYSVQSTTKKNPLRGIECFDERWPKRNYIAANGYIKSSIFCLHKIEVFLIVAQNTEHSANASSFFQYRVIYRHSRGQLVIWWSATLAARLSSHKPCFKWLATLAIFWVSNQTLRLRLVDKMKWFPTRFLTNAITRMDAWHECFWWRRCSIECHRAGSWSLVDSAAAYV